MKEHIKAWRELPFEDKVILILCGLVVGLIWFDYLVLNNNSYNRGASAPLSFFVFLIVIIRAIRWEVRDIVLHVLDIKVSVVYK